MLLPLGIGRKWLLIIRVHLIPGGVPLLWPNPGTAELVKLVWAPARPQWILEEAHWRRLVGRAQEDGKTHDNLVVLVVHC